MHFYSHLITILFPFTVLGNQNEMEPPVGFDHVVDYQGNFVVTYNNEFVIAKEV
jgi:hypothetical protein